MREIKINQNWKFWKENNAFALVWEIPADAKEVTLPHDAMLINAAHPESPNGNNTGYRDGDTYVYTKILHAPKEWKNKIIKLKFEGVYMNAFVYVNGQMAAKNPFGYTTFYVDLNDYLNYDADNVIRVLTRTGAMSNSRWYSGEGIYRDVYLLEAEPTYIVPEGVQIRTLNAQKEMALIEVSVEIRNETFAPVAVTLVNDIKNKDNISVAGERSVITLFGNEMRKVTQRIVVKDPSLWSADSPELYTCHTYLYDENQLNVCDDSVESFGIRTLQVDPIFGLRVNGETVKLRGSCIHHDSGLLGAATYEDAQFRQIYKLKEAGFNAIRMAHQPMAPAMLRACDQFGMYVMDEAFDMWNRSKTDYDYGLYFAENWEKDITAMVRKDFNHPSVIMYSVGNEISEIANAKGTQTCYELCRKVKSLDPDRFTLSGVNGVFTVGDQVERIFADMANELETLPFRSGTVNDFMVLMGAYMDKLVMHDAVTENLEKAFAYTDIAGYNYMQGRYKADGEKYPNRVIVGSENCPPHIVDNWKQVKELSYLIGDFTWTGWDYLGEAGAGIPAYAWGEGGFSATYPAQLSYMGDIDITGYRRPLSYLREIVFGLRKDPYIAVQNPYKDVNKLMKTPWVLSDTLASWNWNKCDNKHRVVEVYSPGSEVELMLNGTSLGRKPAGEAAGYRVLFDVDYEPGTLTAVAYENGEEIGRMDMKTASDHHKIVLIPEKNVREEELLFVAVEIQDEKGVLVTDDDQEITLDVDGAAQVLGFGSGNPKPAYNFNEGKTKTFNGRGQIILKRVDDNAEICINVQAENGMTETLNYK